MGIFVYKEKTILVMALLKWAMNDGRRYDSSTLGSDLKGMVIDVLVYIKCRKNVK